MVSALAFLGEHGLHCGSRLLFPVGDRALPGGEVPGVQPDHGTISPVLVPSEPARLLNRPARLAAAAALAILCGATIASAAPLRASPVMRIWDADDGLLQHSVKALARTPDGYLWLGTEAGLYRFDGFDFVRYAHFLDSGLPADRIRALAVDPDGALWIATTDGVARRVEGRFTSTQEKWTDLDVRGLFLDESDRPWAVSSEDSPVRVSGPSHPAIDVLRAEEHPVVSLAFARDGSVWAPTDKDDLGVLRWDPRSGALEVVQDIPPNTSLALALSDGSVLVGGDRWPLPVEAGSDQHAQPSRRHRPAGRGRWSARRLRRRHAAALELRRGPRARRPAPVRGPLHPGRSRKRDLGRH